MDLCPQCGGRKKPAPQLLTAHVTKGEPTMTLNEANEISRLRIENADLKAKLKKNEGAPAAQPSEVARLEGDNGQLRKDLLTWQKSHAGWVAAYTELKEQAEKIMKDVERWTMEKGLRPNAQQATTPKYEWSPSIGDPGYVPGGRHDRAAYQEYCDSLERVRQDALRQEQANQRFRDGLASFSRRRGHTWEPNIGDEGYVWKEKKEGVA